MTVRLATGANILNILKVVDIVEPLRTAADGLVAIDRPWTAQAGARLIASPDAGVWVSRADFIAGSLSRPGSARPPSP